MAKKHKTKTVSVSEILPKLELAVARLKKSRRKKMTAAQFFQFFIDVAEGK